MAWERASLSVSSWYHDASAALDGHRFTAPGWRSRNVGPALLGRVVFLALGVALVVAGALLFSVLESRLTDMMLSQAAARAIDQAQLGVLNQLTAEDFTQPFDGEKLAKVDAELAPLLERVRQPGSGILRVNVFAADATLLASDESSLRGQRIETDAPLLSAALHGGVAAERSTLNGPENSDMRARAVEALEVYVPLTRD